MLDSEDVTGGPIRPGEGGEATTLDRETEEAVEEGRAGGDLDTFHETAAVMLSFGAVHPGREALAVDTFTEVSRFLGEVLADGVIESFKPYFYDGGTVGGSAGFFLIGGHQEALDALRRREDFRRLVLRAGAATSGVHVHPLIAGSAAGRMVNLYRSVREELGLLAGTAQQAPAPGSSQTG